MFNDYILSCSSPHTSIAVTALYPEYGLWVHNLIIWAYICHSNCNVDPMWSDNIPRGYSVYAKHLLWDRRHDNNVDNDNKMIPAVVKIVIRTAIIIIISLCNYHSIGNGLIMHPMKITSCIHNVLICHRGIRPVHVKNDWRIQFSRRDVAATQFQDWSAICGQIRSWYTTCIRAWINNDLMQNVWQRQSN